MFCLYVCASRVHLVSAKGRRGHTSPRTEVIDNCESPWRGLELTELLWENSQSSWPPVSSMKLRSHVLWLRCCWHSLDHTSHSYKLKPLLWNGWMGEKAKWFSKAGLGNCSGSWALFSGFPCSRTRKAPGHRNREGNSVFFKAQGPQGGS